MHTIAGGLTYGRNKRKQSRGNAAKCQQNVSRPTRVRVQGILRPIPSINTPGNRAEAGRRAALFVKCHDR